MSDLIIFSSPHVNCNLTLFFFETFLSPPPPPPPTWFQGLFPPRLGGVERSVALEHVDSDPLLLQQFHDFNFEMTFH